MITIKSEKDIQSMREGGRILATILAELGRAVRPGITTKCLDELARELILSYGVKPAFLGYNNFPAVLCTSVNDEVVHGIPSERILKAGDIIGLDFGIIYEELNTDAAITVPVVDEGELTAWQAKNKKTGKLIAVTKQALDIGIDAAKVGNRVGAIGNAVQSYVEKQGFSVVRDLVGHGIGKKLHEEPYVPNYGSPDEGPILKAGMTIAIEPMVTRGGWEVVVGDDDTVFKTADGSWAAHFEHTIVITDAGPEILTTT